MDRDKTGAAIARFAQEVGVRVVPSALPHVYVEVPLSAALIEDSANAAHRRGAPRRATEAIRRGLGVDGEARAIPMNEQYTLSGISIADSPTDLSMDAMLRAIDEIAALPTPTMLWMNPASYEFWRRFWLRSERRYWRAVRMNRKKRRGWA